METTTVEQAIIEEAASQARQYKVVPVRKVAESIHVGYRQTLAAFRNLEDDAVGRLIIGRRGFATRFEWYKSPKDVLQHSGFYNMTVGEETITAELQARALKVAADAAVILARAMQLAGVEDPPR